MLIAGDESGQQPATPPGPVVIRADNPASPALQIHRFRNLRISGLTFRGPGQGLSVQRSSGVVVQRCSFEGLSRGLVLGQCQDVRVESSVFSRCTLGVFCQSSVRTRLAHLTVSGASSAGILVLSSGEGAIRNSPLDRQQHELDRRRNLRARRGPATITCWRGARGRGAACRSSPRSTNGPRPPARTATACYVTPAFQDPDKYDLHPAATVTWAGGLPGARSARCWTPRWSWIATAGP